MSYSCRSAENSKAINSKVVKNHTCRSVKNRVVLLGLVWVIFYADSSQIIVDFEPSIDYLSV